MFENFFDQMTTLECNLEIERNGSVQRQIVQAPKLAIQQTFLKLAQEARTKNFPMRFKLSRPIQVYSPFDKMMLNREVSIEVKNRFFTDKEN